MNARPAFTSTPQLKTLECRMFVRRLGLVLGLVGSFASLCFGLGSWSNQRLVERQLAASNARIDTLRGEMTLRLAEFGRTGTSGNNSSDAERRGALVDEIKRQLQSEMGLTPVRLLRERRNSFVELN